ncbi:MAG: phosphate ABC transporter permease PstA [Dehalococcoidia bacterium]
MAAEQPTTAAGRAHLFRPNQVLRGSLGGIFIVLGLASIVLALGMLVYLVLDVVLRGAPWLDWQFLTSFDSRFPARAGILAALAGTGLMMAMTLALALPIGVMAAIYLEEYARESWLKSFIQINISNLAGVPSIIYGLLGLTIFVRQLGLGRSILAGAMTMALLVLPVIVVATQEALRAVPSSIRDASLALGATKSQTIWHHVLPQAVPGILTGNILAASRAIGETAPLVTIGALTFVPFTPQSIMDRFTVLPIQIFNWTSKPQAEFHDLAAAGIVVLLAVLLTMNSIAIVLRQRAGGGRRR